MFKAENITFSYPQDEDEKIVIKDLDLEIKKGSFVAILGHNGSGKSTLAKHFNAILLPSGGKMMVMGMDTSDEEKLFSIRKNVGMVFQNPDNQIVTSIVEDEVAFAPENLGIESEEIKRRVKKALETVGMSEYSKSSPAMLSGGQKQRIAIASALAMAPLAIVLDEPTAMLDPKGRAQIISTIKKLNKENGLTVVLITHYMNEAAEADRVVVINKGEIFMDATPREIFKEVEKIKQIGLDVPEVRELFYMLEKEGIAVPADIISVEDAKNALLELLKDKKND